ncbi:FxsA family protein [Rhodospirillaceae bacterium KN72]|uniref:FxsA family protein n=1 Tax=Pacificispira spongiicola TaxID=2729598 RepID=A0A7Y0HFW7_9PROT|nr:FxsA family protein [Pacificispira spongiicola]NMM45038.1 FxsA family protein [Pacificispira spongiicola]
MPFLILLVFILVPIAEIAIFIEVGDRIGLGWTLFTIVATALIGTALVRQQGLQTLMKVRSDMERNVLPVDAMLTGLCILVAGVLLLTPGFLTDFLGFMLLIPPLRSAIGHGIVHQMRKSGRFTVYTTGATGQSRANSRDGVIEGEFEEVSPDDGPQGGRDGGNPNGPPRNGDRLT